MRLIDADALKAVFEEKSSEAVCGVELCKAIISRIDEAPTVDAVPVIRCIDCKHRPKRTGDEGNGFDFEFPDHVCPCQCEDGWYNWMPKDDWYCADGERKEE